MREIASTNVVKNIWYYGLYLVIFLIAYRSCLFTEYGLGDDIDTLHKYLATGTNSLMFLKNLRPLYAVICDLPFDFVNGKLSNFWVLRLAYLVFLGVSCLITRKIFISTGVNAAHSFLLALLVGLSPASQAIISYGIMSLAPLGAIAAAIAFSAANISYNSKTLTRQLCFIGLAGVLIIASLSIYSVYAQFFWVFVLAEFIINYNKNSEYSVYKKGLIYLALFGVSTLIYLYLSYNLLPGIFEYELTSRAGATSNLLVNFIDFLVRPFRDSINLLFLSYYGPLSKSNIMANLPSYLLSSAILGTSLFLHWRGRNNETTKQKLLFLFICFGIICLSYLSHLLLNVSFYPYRTQLALFSSMLIFTYFAILPTFHKNSRELIIGMITFSVIGVMLANTHLSEMVVNPTNAEWEYVNEKVLSAIKYGHSNFIVIPPTEKMKMSKKTYYDDFGVLISMTNNNRMKQMINLILHYNSKDYSKYTIYLQEEPTSSSNIQDNTTIIDMRKFYK